MTDYTDDGDNEEGVVEETIDNNNVFSLRNDASCGTPQMLLRDLLKDLQKGDCKANKLLIIAYECPEDDNEDSKFQLYNCGVTPFEAISLTELVKQQFIDMML